MLFYVFSAFCVAAFGLSATGELMLPVITCERDSANYSACLKNALEEAWPRFLPGLPDFDFPPLDPLFYEHEKFKINLDVIRGKITASNVTATGLSKILFFDVRTHFLDDVFRLEIDAQVPKLHSKGDANVDAIISVFRVIDKGHFDVIANDVRGTWDLIGHVVNDTWIVEHFGVTLSLGNLKVNFDTFLEENKEINNVALTFINEYWPVMYRVLLPLTADVWDPWLAAFPNKLFSKVPFSKIFP